MNERELLEQIVEEPSGRALDWVVEFLRDAGSDPFVSLKAMWLDEQIIFIDEHRSSVPRFVVERVLRERDDRAPVSVACTPHGCKIAYS